MTDLIHEATAAAPRDTLAAQLEDLNARRKRLADERAPLAQHLTAAREAGDAPALAVLQPQLAAIDTLLADADEDRQMVADRIAAIDREAANAKERARLCGAYEDAVGVQRRCAREFDPALREAVAEIRAVADRLHGKLNAARAATNAVQAARAAAEQHAAGTGVPLRTVLGAHFDEPAPLPVIPYRDTFEQLDRELGIFMWVLLLEPNERRLRAQAGQLRLS